MSKGEHKQFAPIADVVMFDEGSGPYVRDLVLYAALDPSPNYPESRITIVSPFGTASLTAAQARKLRDQLDTAIDDVITAQGAPRG